MCLPNRFQRISSSGEVLLLTSSYPSGFSDVWDRVIYDAVVRINKHKFIGNLALLYLFRIFFLFFSVSVGLKIKIDTEISSHVIDKFIQKQKHLQTNLFILRKSNHLISPAITCLLVEILDKCRVLSPKYFSLPIKSTARSWLLV